MKNSVPVYHWWKSDSPFIETGNDAFSGSDGERKSRESKKTAGKGTARQRLSWKAEFKEAGTAEWFSFPNIESTYRIKHIKGVLKKWQKSMALILA